MNFLCITTYFKGAEFMKACHAAGNKVYLLTREKLKNEPWPHDVIEDIFYIEKDSNTGKNLDKVKQGFAWLMRTTKIDRIVALDDFDVDKAAFLREEFRIPGMGQTTVRHFRDKLAMRMKAAEAGIPVPPFSPLFTDIDITEYAERTAPPWVVKPRTEASAAGIKKVHTKDELWQVVHQLGNERHNFLVEQFKPGDVYHVDALSVNGKIKFSRVSQYLSTPYEVAHGGGVFRSVTVPFKGEDDQKLQKLNVQVMKAFGMNYSASHTEYIKSKEDGKFYFLETASRVGGAHLSDMVEHSSGVNLWEEWAKIETAAATDAAYKLPKVTKEYAGIVVSLSRFEEPDMSGFNDPEVVWKINKKNHIGMIVKSKSRERVIELLDEYTRRILNDFHAAVAAPDKIMDD